MKLSVKYQEIAWWFWAATGVSIMAGLIGIPSGFLAALLISVANLIYFMVRDSSAVSFDVQIRVVWLAFVLVAMLPGMGWFFYVLALGMVMVVFFDRCGIAVVLKKMPWNRGGQAA